MHGVAVWLSCKPHIICVNDFGCERFHSVSCGPMPGCEHETDCKQDDNNTQSTDETPYVSKGYRVDLDCCLHEEL